MLRDRGKKIRNKSKKKEESRAGGKMGGMIGRQDGVMRRESGIGGRIMEEGSGGRRERK